MGKFIIKATKTGFTFSLKAGNGEVIATGGEVYNTLDSVKKGIASVAKNAPAANLEDQTIEGFQSETNPKFEIYKDKSGEFRFHKKKKNGEIIAASEGYVKSPRKSESIGYSGTVSHSISIYRKCYGFFI